MKKIIFTLVLLFAVSSFSQAQKYFKPGADLVIRGTYAAWLSTASYKDYYKAFPSGQIELAYNVSPQFTVYGTADVSIIAPKDKSFSIPGYSATESNSVGFNFYAGPRYNILIPGNKKMNLYLDAGLGLYTLKFGDYKETQSTNPPATINYSYRSIAQFGFNFGAGVNVDLNKSTFFNLNVKYHNVPKKSNVTLKETATMTTTQNGTTTTTNLGSELTPVDVPARSTFQFGIGIGFRFGM
jgi:opacity protein-like surface antigen